MSKTATHVTGTIIGNSQTAPLPDADNTTRSVPRGIALADRLVFTIAGKPIPAVAD